MKRIIYGLSGFIIFAFNYPALAEIPVKRALKEVSPLLSSSFPESGIF